MQDNFETLLYQGTTKEITLPSGRVITIRELNGTDEGILSNQSLAEQNKNTAAFISGLVVADPGAKGGKPTVEQVMQWPVNDKYYALMAIRRLSYGDIVKFPYICPRCEKRSTFKEDLSLFDYSPEEENPEIKRSTYNIKKYPTQTNEVTLTLSSGKVIKYNLLNTESEKVKLDTPEDARNINLDFTIRGLKILMNGEYTRVHHFGIFGPSDLRELRKSLTDNDLTFTPLTLVACSCGNKEYHNILSVSDFFYPTEI